MPTQKYNIDCLIIANQGIRNAFKNLLPLKEDSRLWNVEYRVNLVDPDIEESSGRIGLSVHICFEVENDRGTVLANLKASDGMFNNCEDGTYIQITTNDHEFNENIRTGDWILDKWGVDSIGIYSENFIEGISQGRVY
jgi:hypothetical protein